MSRLCLSRNIGQSIVIDVPAGQARRIKISLNRSKWRHLMLTIDADQDVIINRSELLKEGDGYGRSDS